MPKPLHAAFWSACSLLPCLCLHAQSVPDSAKNMEEVVVTGQYQPQSIKRSVYKVRTIRSEQIRQRGATDLLTVLGTEAGIRLSTDYALSETDISLMGTNGQNVKILLDGVPLADRGSTRQSLGQIDINTVDHIEIVDGPMSVSYGTDALAGVINIITKRAVNGQQHVSVNARVQEESVGDTYSPFAYEGIHQEHIGVDWSDKKWNASLYASRNNFGGFRDTAIYPVKEWKPKDQWLGGASLGYRSARSYTYYRLDFLRESIYAAGAVNTNNYKALDQYFITHRYTHQLQNDWRLNSRVQVNTALSYQDYKRQTETYEINYRYNSKTPTDPSLPGNEGQWDLVPFKEFFLRSTAQIKISDELSVQPGIEVRTDHTSGQRVKGTPTISDYSVFASAEYKPSTKLALRPGLRFSKNSVYKAPPVIPSLNARISLSEKLDMRLSYGRGFRAPILRELYFLFKDGNHDIVGNTALKAEYSNSYQLSLGWQPARTQALKVSSFLSGFYNDFRNRIELAVMPGTSTYTYVNIARYKTTGATLENTLGYKSLSATINASYIGRYNELSGEPAYKANDLPTFTWSPEVSANLVYQFKKLDASAGLFYKYTGSLPSYALRTNPSTNTSEVYLAKLEGFHWADLTLSKHLFHYLTLQAGVRNLFNVTRLQSSVQNSGSAHGGGGPVLTGYGRSAFVGLSFQWDK